MSMKNVIAIKVSDLGKQYRLGEIGTGTLSKDINKWWAKLRGKQDPYLTLGEVNDRTKKGGEYVWALKEINFEVEQGNIVGIIGKNGAGKSTLLKVLSKVTGPTTGEIKVRGRLAALLEVGTGFHPEMTGRENIYMNGTIMGMTRKEIDCKLDEIVDFAGVAKYLDTPVKRYSSGMTVRLGFAIAAHLEPEILIVDEVLAVGDAEFQKKAIGKMQEVSQSGGRTVLFVSHNLGSIKSLCNKCILMNNGMIDSIGGTEEIINKYLSISRNEFGKSKIIKRTVELLESQLILHQIAFYQNGSLVDGNLLYNAFPLVVEFEIEVTDEIPTFQFAVQLFNKDMNLLLVSYKNEQRITGEVLEKGFHKVTVTFPRNLFIASKLYFVQPLLSITGRHLISDIIIPIEFSENGSFKRNVLGSNYNGDFTLPILWTQKHKS